MANKKFTEEEMNHLRASPYVLAALKAINDFGRALAKGVAERMPRIALTKYAFYNAVKQLARWIGVNITKDSFAKGVSKVIPILGGIFSGGLTVVLMLQMGNRLIRYLKGHPFAPYDRVVVA